MTSPVAAPDSPDVHPDLDDSRRYGPWRFWLHALGWLVFYLTVVVAWGQRNSWPDDLILCVLAAPVNAIVIATLYAAYGFGTRIDSHRAQQEQLIAALVLAVGVASGQLFLMNLGLAALAIAWLRPARPDVDWTEWLKIPLVLFTALPFWLDLHGGRTQVFQFLDDPIANPTFQLPLALTATQNRLLSYCALLSLVLLLHGRVFWIALPLLPVFLFVIAALPRWIPSWAEWPPVLRQVTPWGLGIVLFAGLSWFAVRVDAACRRLVSGEWLRRWFEERRYPPWLAVLVVIISQMLPVRSMQWGAPQMLAGAGLLLTAAILVTLRWRSGRGPIHSRSVALVAGALLLNLIAEFTTTDSLRRLAVAFVLVGLVSWHRLWHLRIFLASGFIAILLLAVPSDPASGLSDPALFTGVRIGCAGLLILLLGWFSLGRQPAPGEAGYPEQAWVPSKRFAFILLGLMMLFQTAAAFWPDHQIGATPKNPAPPPSDEGPLGARMSTTGQAVTYQVLDRAGWVQVSIAFPKKNPYLIESPENALERHGWQVVQRVRIRHPQGEAGALKIVRDGQYAAALWWFEQGPTSFSNHLYARRVLWSSWHLADRQLRHVRVESLAITDPNELAAFAARNDWFSSLEAPSDAGSSEGPKP
ncbi:MAG: hypothetical protein AB7O66_22815 [Limisphaerales bacterium]